MNIRNALREKLIGSLTSIDPRRTTHQLGAYTTGLLSTIYQKQIAPVVMATGC